MKQNKSVFLIQLVAVILALFMANLPVRAQPSALPIIDAELRANYPLIESVSVGETERRLASAKPPVILDVREENEFSVSHLNGAIRIAPDADLNDILQIIGYNLKGRDIIFYCSVGVRSTQLADRVRDGLKAKGAARISNLSEGIFGWHNANRPLVRGSKPTIYVHPYNAIWGQLINRQNLTAYDPVTSQTKPPENNSLNEPLLRLGSFLGVFALLAFAEYIRPRRPRLLPRKQRWFAHFGMLGLATIVVRMMTLLVPLIGATAAAFYAAQHQWGVFNLLHLPVWLEIVSAVALLDLAIWAQHVATHHIPLLWRIHRVHHSDRDLDASSALRFHPAEILLSALYKLIIIIALGPAVVAVIAFEILLNASAMFNHANWFLPERIDRVLRLIIVTPDMHRIHHSVIRAEHNRNFGFCLSIWDRMFGTYVATPVAGQDGLIIGLPDWQSDNRPARLGWLLNMPFRR